MPVGAIAIMSVQRTMNNGLWAGFSIGMGAAFGDLIYASIAGFGVTFIKDFLMNNKLWLSIGGGIFLLFIGYKIYVSDTIKQIRSKKNLTKRKMANDFFSSLFLALSNPITIIGFTGFFASFGIINDKTTSFHIVMLLLGVFLGATTWWFSISLLINRFKNKISLRNIVYINRFAGIFVFAIGVVLIVAVLVFKKGI